MSTLTLANFAHILALRNVSKGLKTREKLSHVIIIIHFVQDPLKQV